MTIALPATFMRGGTSKALMFRRQDLPADQANWDRLLLGAMGSPDPYGRQLNGMGGGLSSLSKVCVVGASELPEADLDFTFAQVQIKRALVDYSGNCGNMSAAIGPFGLTAGLVERDDGEATVLVRNTNTAKLMRATFAVKGGLAVEDGDLAIPGVAGSGAPVRLDFLDPGGPATGALLPTGGATDVLATPHGTFMVSMIDAANACVFVAASDVGLDGTETPEQLESQPQVLATLTAIRAHAAVAMGLVATLEAAAVRPMTPFVARSGCPQALCRVQRGDRRTRGLRPERAIRVQWPTAPRHTRDRRAVRRCRCPDHGLRGRRTCDISQNGRDECPGRDRAGHPGRRGDGRRGRRANVGRRLAGPVRYLLPHLPEAVLRGGVRVTGGTVIVGALPDALP